MLIQVITTAIALQASKEPTPDSRRESVVRTHLTRKTPPVSKPWTTSEANRSTGTGFIIDGERTLTNGHVAADATDMLIESNQPPRRVPAEVEQMTHGIDLAILTVDGPGFFELHPPVRCAQELPQQQG